MFVLTVIRILLAVSLLFVLCSAQKSFLKGLLIGSLLGHKKGALLHEKGEKQEFHHYEKEYIPPPPVEKEYIPVPVHEEPRYIPIYIIKECKKAYSPMPHYHDHHHDMGTVYEGKYPTEEEGNDYKSASNYKGTLDGYAESRFNPVHNRLNLTSSSTAKTKKEDDSVGIVLTLFKDFGNKY